MELEQQIIQLRLNLLTQLSMELNNTILPTPPFKDSHILLLGFKCFTYRQRLIQNLRSVLFSSSLMSNAKNLISSIEIASKMAQSEIEYYLFDNPYILETHIIKLRELLLQAEECREELKYHLKMTEKVKQLEESILKGRKKRSAAIVHLQQYLQAATKEYSDFEIKWNREQVMSTLDAKWSKIGAINPPSVSIMQEILTIFEREKQLLLEQVEKLLTDFHRQQSLRLERIDNQLKRAQAQAVDKLTPFDASELAELYFTLIRVDKKASSVIRCLLQATKKVNPSLASQP